MYRNDNTNRIQFSSITELAAYCQKNREKTDYFDRTNDKFFGTTTGSEALAMCFSGDDALIPEAKKMIDDILVDAALPTMMDEPEVAGCYPVAAEFLSGIPECMRMPSRVGSEQAPLSIFLDLTVSAGVTPKQYKQRGIATLALVLALSAVRPIQLEVGCVMGASKEAKGLPGESVSIVSVVINTAPLDISTAAYALTNVAFIRRLIYGASIVEHRFTGGWPVLKGAEYAEPQSKPHIKRVTEILDLPGETFYMPAICIEDAGFQQAVNRPAEWVRKHFERFANQLETA